MLQPCDLYENKTPKKSSSQAIGILIDKSACQIDHDLLFTSDATGKPYGISESIIGTKHQTAAPDGSQRTNEHRCNKCLSGG